MRAGRTRAAFRAAHPCSGPAESESRPASPPRRQLWDRLRWNVLSRGWRRVRNPYFLLSREICTAARCNNLSISSKHQTHAAGQKGPYCSSFLYSEKKITFPSQTGQKYSCRPRAAPRRKAKQMLQFANSKRCFFTQGWDNKTSFLPDRLFSPWLGKLKWFMAKTKYSPALKNCGMRRNANRGVTSGPRDPTAKTNGWSSQSASLGRKFFHQMDSSSVVKGSVFLFLNSSVCCHLTNKVVNECFWGEEVLYRESME